MINYHSIEQIIQIGSSMSETLINNVGYDDNVYTATGCNWFNFNGTVSSNIYISGNTWFGFGNSSEHLRVNRRDAKMWYLYREEGTLYNYYHFLKFRWDGYSAYSQTSGSYKLTYDVILFNTGDICLHMVKIPISNYDGNFILTYGSNSLTYTKPTMDNPYVTFYKQEDGSYIAKNELINLQMPYDKKYLIYDDVTKKYYNIVNDALNELNIEEITSDIFKTYGNDIVPLSNLLITLQKPKILYWQDSDDDLPLLKANITAVPLPQTIITTDIDISDSSIKGIEKVSGEYKGNPVIAVSFDNGTSWKSYNEQWTLLSDSTTGMPMETLAAIPAESWNEQIKGLTSFKMRFTLTAADDVVTNIIIDFMN